MILIKATSLQGKLFSWELCSAMHVNEFVVQLSGKLGRTPYKCEEWCPVMYAVARIEVTFHRCEQSHSDDVMVLTAVRGSDVSIRSVPQDAGVTSGVSSLDNVDSNESTYLFALKATLG